MINCCLWGAPSPVYKGVEEEEGWPHGARPRGGFLLLVGVGFPPSLVGVPFLFQEVERGKGEEREKERGGRCPLLVQFGPAHGGRADSPCGPSLLSTKAHEGPLLPR